MRRVISCLAATPHRYIVSKGPLHAEIELAPNMWGAEFVPQASILPLADLVITHGGNNTTTECLHFGKPMIVLALVLGPVRQRATDGTNSGSASGSTPIGFTDAQMHEAISRLLADTRCGRASNMRPRSSSSGTGYAMPPASSSAPPPLTAGRPGQAIRERDGVGRAAAIIEGAASV